MNFFKPTTCKIFFAAIVLFFATLKNSDAQSITDSITVKNKFGLLFSVDNFSLQNETIGLKYCRNTDISYSFFLKSEYIEEKYSIPAMSENLDRTLNIELYLSLSNYFNRSENAAGYYGFGFGYKLKKYQQKAVDEISTAVNSERNNFITSRIFIGFEYMFLERFSLSGQEQFIFDFLISDNEYSENRKIRLSSAASSLLLTFYF